LAKWKKTKLAKRPKNIDGKEEQKGWMGIGQMQKSGFIQNGFSFLPLPSAAFPLLLRSFHRIYISALLIANNNRKIGGLAILSF